MVESNEKIKPVAKCMNTGNEVGSLACLCGMLKLRKLDRR